VGAFGEALDAAHKLVEELRQRGLHEEAAIVGRALDVASAAASGNGEVSRHALISLSELVCVKLDELERDDDERPPTVN
jgi:hypothetical protein